MNPAVLAAIFLLCVLVSAAPLARVPVSVILGIAVLDGSLDISEAALIGAIGATVGRLWIAMAARHGRTRFMGRDKQAARQQLGGMLGRDPRFRMLTFFAGLVPFIPDWFVFPLLGRIGAPLRYAAAGSLFGRWLIYSVATWVAVGLARWATTSDHDAIVLLGVLGVLSTAIGFIRRVDMDHLRATGTVRVNERAQQSDQRLTAMFMQAGNRSPHRNDDIIDLEAHDDDGDDDSSVIEASVVDDDDESDDSSDRS
jgi:hypothetical protein